MEVDLKTPTKRNHDGAWIVLRPDDFIALFDMQTVLEMGEAGDQTKKLSTENFKVLEGGN